MKLTSEQIKEVVRKSGASEERVRKIAEKMPDIKGPGIRIWACFRCLTCFGLIRKIIWCIICVS